MAFASPMLHLGKLAPHDATVNIHRPHLLSPVHGDVASYCQFSVSVVFAIEKDNMARVYLFNENARK